MLLIMFAKFGKMLIDTFLGRKENEGWLKHDDEWQSS